MAHPQQIKFIQLVQKYFLDNNQHSTLNKRRILEIGSYDVNGSIRSFLQDTNTEYIGVDLCEGKGVDIVSYGHQLNLPNESFDVAISCECFEHDPNWIDTFNNMCRMTKNGGVVTFTCATLGRVEHGTTRSNAEHSPGTQFIGLDYYKNLSKEDFYSAIDINLIFSEHYFFFEKSSYDLYFVGIKKGGEPVSKLSDNFYVEIAEIKKAGKFRFKLIDLPVYFSRVFLSESTFQNFACAYLNKVRPFRSFIKKIGRGFN